MISENAYNYNVCLLNILMLLLIIYINLYLFFLRISEPKKDQGNLDIRFLGKNLNINAHDIIYLC